MPITAPLLPPKKGYVEVVDEHGNHVYRATKETTDRLKEQASFEELSNTVNILVNPKENDEAILDSASSSLELRAAIQMLIPSISDEQQILSIPSVYPFYKVGHDYKTKDIFRFGMNTIGDPQLYQVLQDHTSSEEFPPDTSVSLYKKIGVSEDGTPEWVQPLGATDAYSIGEVVMHDGKKWESEIDNNVWEPGIYGWKEYSDIPSEIPEWKQPSGSEDAYKKGDVVMYNGSKYESLIDGNVWAPDAYPDGWKKLD